MLPNRRKCRLQEKAGAAPPQVLRRYSDPVRRSGVGSPQVLSTPDLVPPLQHLESTRGERANQEAAIHGRRKEEEAGMGIARATHLVQPAGRKGLATAVYGLPPASRTGNRRGEDWRARPPQLLCLSLSLCWPLRLYCAGRRRACVVPLSELVGQPQQGHAGGGGGARAVGGRDAGGLVLYWLRRQRRRAVVGDCVREKRERTLGFHGFYSGFRVSQMFEVDPTVRNE